MAPLACLPISIGDCCLKDIALDFNYIFHSESNHAQKSTEMATTKYDDLEKECYILVRQSPTVTARVPLGLWRRADMPPQATDSDLVIRVLESEEVKDGPKQSELVPKKVHLFKVKRDILAASSDYFRTMFGKPGFRESQQTIVDLKEDLPVSVEVWLRIIHGSDTKATYGRVDLKGVWEVLAAAHK